MYGVSAKGSDRDQIGVVIYELFPSSGNRTPGSSSTFWIPPPACTQASFKALGCSRNCRRLGDGSFQLTHMSRDDHVVELIEPWRPRRRQNIITALPTLPQG